MYFSQNSWVESLPSQTPEGLYIYIYIDYKNVTRASINIKVSCEPVKFQFLVNCPFKGFLFFCCCCFISQCRSGVRVSRGTPVCL